MQIVRGALGAFFIFCGLAMQGIAWLLQQAGWYIECAGNRVVDGI